jgi:hypothetical protein
VRMMKEVWEGKQRCRHEREEGQEAAKAAEGRTQTGGPRLFRSGALVQPSLGLLDLCLPRCGLYPSLCVSILPAWSRTSGGNLAPLSRPLWRPRRHASHRSATRASTWTTEGFSVAPLHPCSSFSRLRRPGALDAPRPIPRRFRARSQIWNNLFCFHTLSLPASPPPPVSPPRHEGPHSSPRPRVRPLASPCRKDATRSARRWLVPSKRHSIPHPFRLPRYALSSRNPRSVEL